MGSVVLTIFALFCFVFTVHYWRCFCLRFTAQPWYLELPCSTYSLTLNLTRLSTHQHPATNSRLDHFALRSPSQHHQGHVCCAMQTTAKTFVTVQCAVVNARVPPSLHCSQLPIQLYVFYTSIPFSGKGSANGLRSTRTKFSILLQ